MSNDKAIDVRFGEWNDGMAADCRHVAGIDDYLFEDATVVQMRCCYLIAHAGFWLVLEVVGKALRGELEHADIVDEPSVGVRRRHLPI